MERSNKFLLILILAIIMIVAGIATVSALFHDDLIVNVEMTGQDATVNILAVPYGHDNDRMRNQMENYVLREMNNIDSDADTLKEGLEYIARNYGFTSVAVNIHSQFGEDVIPMKVRVDGLSMYPTLENGENVIIEKNQNPKIGDIIVVRDPEYGLLIKRLGNISGNQIFLASDNNGTINTVVNGTPVVMIALEKWTDASNVVGIAREFNV